MCEQCKPETETLEEQSTLSSSLLSEQGQTEDQPILFFEPFEISTENLAESLDIQFDKDEFIKGLKEASRYAGMYTGLVNCGMDLENAMGVILTDMSVKMNTEMAKIQANAQVEVSKNKSLVLDSTQL